MIDLLRQEVMCAAKTLVVKIGTNVLTGSDGSLDVHHVRHLAEQLAALRRQGREVVVVSSGAIGAGMGRIGLKTRPKSLPELQAAAALGQSRLIEAYEQALGPLGFHAAQVLLTAEDFNHRERYLNVRNTLRQLLAWNAIPVINENDTISVAEIKFGDNDQLAAMVTNLLRAPLLIILSITAGFYVGDPTQNPHLQPLPTVLNIDEALLGHVTNARSPLGSGGMRSKLQAVQMATSAGESVCIASGREPNILVRLLAGETLGTLFPATGESVTSWKRWIGFTAKPKGTFVVDAGARDALMNKHRSLLPIGVVEVRGRFSPGEIVSIECPAGVEFARGLTNYSSEEIRKIMGRPSTQLVELLPNALYDEAIHRDNLMVIQSHSN
jgi:glutamate 5-kinase